MSPVQQTWPPPSAPPLDDTTLFQEMTTDMIPTPTLGPTEIAPKMRSAKYVPILPKPPNFVESIPGTKTTWNERSIEEKPSSVIGKAVNHIAKKLARKDGSPPRTYKEPSIQSNARAVELVSEQIGKINLSGDHLEKHRHIVQKMLHVVQRQIKYVNS